MQAVKLDHGRRAHTVHSFLPVSSCPDLYWYSIVFSFLDQKCGSNSPGACIEQNEGLSMEHFKLVLAVTEGFEQSLKGTGILENEDHSPKFATCSHKTNLILGMMSYAEPLNYPCSWMRSVGRWEGNVFPLFWSGCAVLFFLMWGPLLSIRKWTLPIFSMIEENSAALSLRSGDWWWSCRSSCMLCTSVANRCVSHVGLIRMVLWALSLQGAHIRHVTGVTIGRPRTCSCDSC